MLPLFPRLCDEQKVFRLKACGRVGRCVRVCFVCGCVCVCARAFWFRGHPPALLAPPVLPCRGRGEGCLSYVASARRAKEGEVFCQKQPLFTMWVLSCLVLSCLFLSLSCFVSPHHNEWLDDRDSVPAFCGGCWSLVLVRSNQIIGFSGRGMMLSESGVDAGSVQA